MKTVEKSVENSKKNTLINILYIRVLQRFLLWSGTELNRRHVDFQSTALPTELPDLQNTRLQI